MDVDVAESEVKPNNRPTKQWILLVLRIALGIIFIISSLSKLSDPIVFVDVVVGYDLLPEGLARAYGYILPWTELLVGIMLVAGLFTRIAASVSVVLAVSFIIANIYALTRPDAGCGENYCGCFGEALPMSSTQSLILDWVMLAIAIPLIIFPQQLLNIWKWISSGGGDVGLRSSLKARGPRFAAVFCACALIVPLVTAAVGPYSSSSDDNSVNASSTQELHMAIQNVLDNEKSVCIFFYKEDCEFCEAQKPIIDELETEYGDRVGFFREDGEGRKVLIEEFELEGLPSVMLISGKNEQDEYIKETFLGFTEKSVLEERLSYMLEDGELTGESHEEGDFCSSEDAPCKVNIIKKIDEALDSGKFALLSFRSNDCVRCLEQEEVVTQIEDTYGDHLVVIPVDGDEGKEAAEYFGVKEYPTVLLVSRLTGDQRNYDLYHGYTDLEVLENRILDLLLEETDVDGTIDDVLDEGRLAVVLFRNVECGQCEAQEAVIANLEQEYPDQITCIWVDTDDDPAAAKVFGIAEYPTVFIVSRQADGQHEREEYEGFTDWNTLKDRIDTLLREQTVVDEEIQDALDDGKLALLSFYTDGCTDCGDQEGVLDGLEDEYPVEIVCVRVDGYEDTAAVSTFGVEQYPTTFLIWEKGDGSHGSERFEGFVDRNTLKGKIDSLLYDIHDRIEASIAAGKLVLVLFRSNECDWCVEQEAVVDELEQEYSGDIDCIRVDGDLDQAAVDEFGVEDYPSVFLIYGNSPQGSYKLESFLGQYTNKETLENRIVALLLEDTIVINRSMAIGKPVFIYFYYLSCPACENQKPIINDLELEYSDRITFIRIDLAVEGQTKLDFDAVPPTMILISGRYAHGWYEYEKFIGPTEKYILQQAIESLL
ncbi:MAG: thioredoxin domain-containing protein [Chloroflexota bacterium]|nr:thioredoxin domain-containing protein [Chloroflexota bacterium]